MTQYINRREGYDKVRKIYGINIVYRKGYCVSWENEIQRHTLNDILELSSFQRQTFKANEVSHLYPGYYILKANDFHKVTKTPLEEWIHNLNTDKIPESANAPGVNMVKKKLKIDRMNKTAKSILQAFG